MGLSNAMTTQQKISTQPLGLMETPLANFIEIISFHITWIECKCEKRENGE
jgi:hypothetical protein